MLHHAPRPTQLHRARPRLVPVPRASDALHDQATRALALRLVQPFAPCWRLLRPRLTSHAVSPRRPFSHKVRSPQVRTRSFPAQSPHLRRLALTTRASRSLARSPCSASPSMRFVFLDSRFRSTLPPHARSPSRSCASLRSRWSTHGRTSTSKIAPMLGAPMRTPRAGRGVALRAGHPG